nr:hypothetical protein [uncultured Undibacterium sp.]
MKLAFGSDNNTFLSISCDAQITSSQTGVSQKQRLTTDIGKLNTVGNDCFAVAVAFDSNRSSTSDTANCARQKWEKESQMFERSEFLTLPIFDLHKWGPEGQWQRGRLSLLTFFGEAKKVSGCRATPDLQARIYQ